MTQYLYIPYGDKEEAKQLGARWDSKERSWFIPDDLDPIHFNKWLSLSYLDPIDEFSKDLRTHGCILKDGEPFCDGKSHRIMVEGDHNGERSGFYVMHLDGVPNGYFINNRSKDTFKKNYFQNRSYQKESEEVIRQRQEEFRLRQQQEAEKKLQKENEIAERLRRKISALPNTLSIESPYFKKKQISGSKYTYIEVIKRPNESGDFIAQTLTCIPLYDISRKLTTVQFINPKGVKRFVKGGRKSGSMHIVNGKIKDTDEYIIICEGYATASSLQKLSQYIELLKDKCAVVSAIDSGNLLSVGQALKSKYPNKKFILAADNDRFSTTNVGVQEANRVSTEIGAIVVIPQFNQDQGTDYNDLITYEGVQTAINQLKVIY